MTLDIPPTYLLATNLRPEEVSELENRIPSLTRKIGEARIILGKITKRERAQFELRRLKLQTEEIPAPGSSNEHETKRRKISDAHDGQGAFSVKLGLSTTYGAVDEDEARAKNTVKVLRLSWLTDSLDKGVVLPYDEYLLYHGRKVSQEATTKRFGSPPSPVRAREILERATQEGARLPASSKHSAKRTHDHGLSLSHPPALIRQTTSEHDKPLPPVPDFLHTTYSCQRPTPVTTPNADFIDQLKEVRILRLLEGDQIGVRAYSSSIASLAAYPHKLASAQGGFSLQAEVVYVRITAEDECV
jgi:DNA polymerase IV